MVAPTSSMDSYIADLLHNVVVSGEHLSLVPDNAKAPAFRHSCHFETSILLMSSPSSRKAPSRWSSDSSIELTKPSRWDAASNSSNGLQAPRRLPDHNDSFIIHQRRFERRGGFVMKSLRGLSTYGGDDLRQKKSVESGVQEDIIQALKEIDAECTSHLRGAFNVPPSLKALPYESDISDDMESMALALKGVREECSS